MATGPTERFLVSDGAEFIGSQKARVASLPSKTPPNRSGHQWPGRSRPDRPKIDFPGKPDSKRQRPPSGGRLLFIKADCAGRNRTTYLQVMSLASYRCSTAHPEFTAPRPGRPAQTVANLEMGMGPPEHPATGRPWNLSTGPIHLSLAHRATMRLMRTIRHGGSIGRAGAG
jgi:hypothetical protein